jgi:hypothetical protein
MEKLAFFFRLLPYLLFLYAGVVSILEVFLPSLRDTDFNRWEVDEGGGSYVKILGWTRMLTAPRVVAKGYMSDGAACAVALVTGVLFVLIAMFGIRHVSGFPAFFPDLFNRL